MKCGASPHLCVQTALAAIAQCIRLPCCKAGQMYSVGSQVCNTQGSPFVAKLLRPALQQKVFLLDNRPLPSACKG